MEETEVDIIGDVSDTAVSLPLNLGWMLITNPLVLDVAVDSLLFNDGAQTLEYAEAVNAGWVNVIYGHNAAGYQTVEVLKPWQGYWLAVLYNDINMTFPIHNTPAEAIREQREDYWAINFNASSDILWTTCWSLVIMRMQPTVLTYNLTILHLHRAPEATCFS